MYPCEVCGLARDGKGSFNNSGPHDCRNAVARLCAENTLLLEQVAAIRKLITGEESQGNFLDDTTIIYAWVRRRMEKAAAEVEEQFRKSNPQNPDSWK